MSCAGGAVVDRIENPVVCTVDPEVRIEVGAEGGVGAGSRVGSGSGVGA